MTDPAFVCPRCGTSSWNPNDRDNGYCGLCHWPTGHPILGAVDPPPITLADGRLAGVTTQLFNARLWVGGDEFAFEDSW